MARKRKQYTLTCLAPFVVQHMGSSKPVAAALWHGDWRANLAPRIGLVSAYLAFDVVALFSSMDQFWYWWVAPFLLGWYVFAQRFIIADAR